MKKYRMSMLLVLTILFTMTACQGAKDDNNQNLENSNSEIMTENIEVTTEVELASDTQMNETSAADIVVLADEELAWFENSFFNTEENRIINMFLTSKYHCAEDIDLYQLFYNGTQVAGTSDVSPEEVKLLKERYKIIDSDIFKTTTAEMDAILQKYAGITLEKSNKVHLDGLYYLEEYDAYYSVVGDTNYKRCEFDYGWKDSKGLITMEYRYGDMVDSNDELYCITLKQVDGTYYFVSNETVK